MPVWLNMYGTISIDKFEDKAIYCKKNHIGCIWKRAVLKSQFKQHLKKGDRIYLKRDALVRL
jgi:hypothetical protein